MYKTTGLLMVLSLLLVNLLQCSAKNCSCPPELYKKYTKGVDRCGYELNEYQTVDGCDAQRVYYCYLSGMRRSSRPCDERTPNGVCRGPKNCAETGLHCAPSMNFSDIRDCYKTP